MTETPQEQLDRIERSVVELAEILRELVRLMTEAQESPPGRTFGARPDVFGRHREA